MDNSNVRDSKSRNSINDRMQNFFVPQSIKPQNMSSNNLFQCGL